jgi:hypothetical protein
MQKEAHFMDSYEEVGERKWSKQPH